MRVILNKLINKDEEKEKNKKLGTSKNKVKKYLET
jgi:hypothetical protein